MLQELKIENMIYEIRGKQVMLDSDLAKLYHCNNGTKEINQAVKNNNEKFPERFSWKLTDDEYLKLRSKILTTNKNNNMSRTNPRVFTEQGVAMLATILKSKVAIETSIKIMDAFVSMRHYIGNNEFRLYNVETKIIDHDNRIELLEKSFDKLEEKRKDNEIYFNGMIYDAYSKILDIFSETKNELIIIDSYADKTILDIIRRLKVKVILITTDKILSKQDIEKYNKQYNNLKVIYNNTFHDRYFIIDKEKIYHCGTSINRIGYKTFSINVISDKDIVNILLTKCKVD